MERIENKLVVDSLWGNIEKSTAKKLNGRGWTEKQTGVFIPGEDAYKYALERISQDEDLENEVKEMIVDWFYSDGNYFWEVGD